MSFRAPRKQTVAEDYEIPQPVDKFVKIISKEDSYSKKGILLPVDKLDLSIPTEGLKNKLEILQPIEFLDKIQLLKGNNRDETYCSTERPDQILNTVHKNSISTMQDVNRYNMVDKLTLGL